MNCILASLNINEIRVYTTHITKILRLKFVFHVSCNSTFVFIAFHLDKDELASDLPLMADCKLIIEPL